MGCVPWLCGHCAETVASFTSFVCDPFALAGRPRSRGMRDGQIQNVTKTRKYEKDRG